MIAIREALQKRRAMGAHSKLIAKERAVSKEKKPRKVAAPANLRILGWGRRLRLKLFALGWVLKTNRSLLAKNQLLLLENRALNSELKSLVENWIPNIAGPVSNRVLQNQRQMSLPELRGSSAADIGLSIDFVESEVEADLSEPAKKTSEDQRSEGPDVEF
jgi:hypothetical protein